MTLHVPQIKTETLSEKELELYQNLEAQPYGEAIAKSVAKKLLEGKGLFHAHRDYCGLGLFFYKDQYVLATAYDGYDAPHEPVLTFDNQDNFVSWLSNENDQSMALYGAKFNNQTITQTRLEWFLEADYSPVWNDYCRYVRDRNGI